MPYLWSDAWLFQAIAIASGSGAATLSDILGAADAVNHAMPTDDELHGALVRLTEAGLIEEIEERFRLTDLVPSAVTAVLRTSGWSRGRAAATAFLGAEEWSPEKNTRDPRNAVEYPGLTTDRLLRADRDYRRRNRR